MKSIVRINSAKVMLQLMRECRLRVIKVKSEPRDIRVAVEENCEWYKVFCATYMTSRNGYPRERTIIRREATMRSLGRIVNGQFQGVYIDRLLPFVDQFHRDYMIEGPKSNDLLDSF